MVFSGLGFGLVYIEHVVIGQKNVFERRTAIVNYIPETTVQKYGEDNFNGDYFLTVVKNSGDKLSGIQATTTIRPSVCDIETADLLGIPDGTPIFFRTVVYRNQQGNILYIAEDKPTAKKLVEYNSIIR